MIRCCRIPLSIVVFCTAVLFFLGLVGLLNRVPVSVLSRAHASEAVSDDAGEGAPGLQLTLESLPDRRPTDTRSTRLVALYVPAGEPVSPFVPVGSFRAAWKGNLTLDLGGEYVFSAEGRGNLTVSLNGVEVLQGQDELRQARGKPVKLKKGRNELRVAMKVRPGATRRCGFSGSRASFAASRSPAPSCGTRRTTRPWSSRADCGRDANCWPRCAVCAATRRTRLPGSSPAACRNWSWTCPT